MSTTTGAGSDNCGYDGNLIGAAPANVTAGMTKKLETKNYYRAFRLLLLGFTKHFFSSS